METFDHYFDQWRLKQAPNREFEWGRGPKELTGELEAVKKRFDDMTREEQRMVWEFKVWPAIAAID